MMKRNPDREKDPIWEHAIEKKEEKGFVCKYCEKFYTEGAPRIKSHLSGKSGGGIRPCPKFVPLHGGEAADNVAATTTATSSRKRPYNHNITLWPIFEPFHAEEDANIVTTSRSSPERPDNNDINTILPQAPSWSNTREGNDEVHMLLVKHFILNNIPLETIEKPYFRSLVNSIAKLGPQYELPSTYSSLAVESLSNLNKEVEQYIRTVLESCSIYGCSVQLHVKKRTQGYIFDKSDVVGYTLYSPKGVIFLNAGDPSYCSYISKSSFQRFSSVAERAIKQEAIQILCDTEKEDTDQDERFYVSSLLYSSKNCSKCTVSFCAQTHVLQLLQLMPPSCTWLSDLLMDVNYVYQYLTQSKSEDLTRAKNPFSELQLVMQHKAELQSSFLDHETASVVSRIINKGKFWEDGKEVLDAFGPLIRILHVFDSFIPDIGYLLEAMELAEAKIDHHYGLNPERFEDLSKIFKSLKSLIIKPIHIAAAYSNPDYMSNKLNTSSMNRQEGIDYMNTSLVKSEKGKFTEQLEIYGDKNPCLFTETAISKLKVYHPVTWWDEFGDVVPVLRRYAIQLLSQPSSCLSHLCHKDKFEGSDLFQKNVKMMEEFKLLGETLFSPIDLIDGPMT